MNTILALAGVVIKELYRRKDFYVLFVMTAVITLLMGSVNFFNEDKIVRYVKDGCLLLIWVASLVIAIGTAARQIPSERESRTIFPLLAKPVTRAQVIVGKFLGCWLACGISLLVFSVSFVVFSGAKDGHWPLAQYFQALWLHWGALAIVVAMVLLGSVIFSAPSANASISLSAILAILLLGAYLNKFAALQPRVPGLLLSMLYFLIPHLEWFYGVRERLVFEMSPLAWSDCLLITAYAAAYVGVFLMATWLVFRRKILTT